MFIARFLKELIVILEDKIKYGKCGVEEVFVFCDGFIFVRRIFFVKFFFKWISG